MVHGQSFDFLRQLRRVGKIKFPILIEDVQGRLGVPSKMFVALLDVKAGRLRLLHFPAPSDDSASTFGSFAEETTMLTGNVDDTP